MDSKHQIAEDRNWAELGLQNPETLQSTNAYINTLEGPEESNDDPGPIVLYEDTTTNFKNNSIPSIPSSIPEDEVGLPVKDHSDHRPNYRTDEIEHIDIKLEPMDFDLDSEEEQPALFNVLEDSEDEPSEVVKQRSETTSVRSSASGTNKKYKIIESHSIADEDEVIANEKLKKKPRYWFTGKRKKSRSHGCPICGKKFKASHHLLSHRRVTPQCNDPEDLKSRIINPKSKRNRHLEISNSPTNNTHNHIKFEFEEAEIDALLSSSEMTADDEIEVGFSRQDVTAEQKMIEPELTWNAQNLTTEFSRPNKSKSYIRCPVCPRLKFRSQVTLTEHINKFHLAHHSKSPSTSSRKKSRKSNPCPDCPLSFHTTYDLQTHTETVHSVGRTYFCQFCARKFRASHPVAQHIRHVEYCQSFPPSDADGISGPWKCPHCELIGIDCSSDSWNDLIQHIRTVHHLIRPDAPEYFQEETRALRQVGEKFKCRMCPMVLNSESSFQTHFRMTHAGSISSLIEPVLKPKPSISNRLLNFECNMCPRRFTTITGRNAHEHSHGTKEMCPVCPVGFNKLPNLVKHMITYHPPPPSIMRDIEEDDEISCKLCGMKFITQLGLQSHSKYAKCGQSGHVSNNQQKQTQIVENLPVPQPSTSQLSLVQQSCPIIPDIVVEDNITCKICGTKFITQLGLQCHSRYAKCGQGSSNQQKGNQIVDINPVTSTPNTQSFPIIPDVVVKDDHITCKTCGIKFITELGLQSHSKYAKCGDVSSNQQKAKGDVLPVTVTSTPTIQLSLVETGSPVIHGVVDKNYDRSCKTCGMKFVTQLGLQNHSNYAKCGPESGFQQTGPRLE